MGTLSANGPWRVPALPLPTGERVLFVDTVATRAYSERTLASEAMGGTEATVVRVASRLARLRPVVVAQACRTGSERGRSGVVYVPYDHKDDEPIPSVGAVVVVRAHKVLRRLRRRYPRAAMSLWLHCFLGRRLRDMPCAVTEADATVVTVSNTHRDAVEAFFAAHRPELAAHCRVETIYNPVADALAADGTPVDADKLLFLSSPHKGLDQVLRAFRHCRRRMPGLRLYIANPGYLERKMEGDLAGVRILGKLPHAQVVHELRSALCLFYPQTTFEETFGLVFAEANAVGTPVLAHPLAAAREVVGDAPPQLLDCSDLDAVADRVEAWRQQRPRPDTAAAFRLASVAAAWNEHLVRQAVCRLQRVEQDTTLLKKAEDRRA